MAVNNPISDLYKDYLQKRSREWLVKLNIAERDYGSDVIVDFGIQNDMTGGQEFELGTAILSKLTIRLKTSEVIPANAKVIPYLALKLPPAMDGASKAWQNSADTWDSADYPWQGGVTEWLPLGEFYIDDRKQVNNVWTFTCYDKLVKADVSYVSQLSYPATMQAVWDEICSSLGFTYDNSVVIDPSYMIQAGPAGYTKRQVMGYIAAANAACVYVGRVGSIRFRRFSNEDFPVHTFTKADYIRVKQTNPVKTYTKVVVVYDTDEGHSYSAGSGDENHTLYVDNPFGTQAMANDLLKRLNGFSYVPVEMDARGYPQIEIGERIRFGTPVASPTWDNADTAWNAADFSWDGYTESGVTLALSQTYSFKGGLKLSLSAPSISEQQSEFQVDGSLSSQINRLNKTAVREGKSYYGATLTRTEGFTVEREDHASKVILNSDKFEFTANGEQALWFDLPSRRFKFSGTLEAVDGVFSGELQAATGTFSGELQAATGTFSGDLQAAGGTFSGDLQAAGGTFTGTLQAANGSFTGDISASTINGGTIIGAQIQNASTLQKILLDNLGFSSYDQNGVKRISIDTLTSLGYQQLQFYGEDGIRTGILSGTITKFNIGAMSGANMVLGAARIAVDSPVFDFQGATINNISLPISAINGLQKELNDLWIAVNGKANISHQHNVNIPQHNHGITNGTQLAISGGGAVTFIAYPGATISTS